jgi:hypothetical protein
VSNYEAKSANAFVQHLAVRLIRNGYVFYVLGEIPKDKAPEGVDAKFVERYQVDDSKWAQSRRMRRGEAKVRYLRFGRRFVLVATHGLHRFFDDEKTVIKDVRESPLNVFGYSIRSREKRGMFLISVRLSFEKLISLRSSILLKAFASEIRIQTAVQSERLLFFSGVKRQLFRIVRELNEARIKAGLEPVRIPHCVLTNPALQVFNL